MKNQLLIILLGTLFLASFAFVPLSAQELETNKPPVTTESQEAPAVSQPQQIQTVTESEVQWLWGEVVSLDTLTKQMVVKYLDYETDTERQISINVDDKTTFENVKSLDEIKTQDTVSIDYIVNVDGQNIAKNINAEKNGSIETLPEEATGEEPKATPGLE